MATELDFRSDLFFYRMVSAAMVSFSGFPSVFDQKNSAGLTGDGYISINGIVTGDRHIRPYEIHKAAIAGNISKNDFVGTVCMMLANTAYEAVKDKNDNSPDFEFFRHIRNASSHLNRFHFRNDEPRRPALWRGVSIDHNLKGDTNPLQKNYCFGKMLGPADVLLLLWDIEQIIINQNHQQTTKPTGKR